MQHRVALHWSHSYTVSEMPATATAFNLGLEVVIRSFLRKHTAWTIPHTATHFGSWCVLPWLLRFTRQWDKAVVPDTSQ